MNNCQFLIGADFKVNSEPSVSFHYIYGRVVASAAFYMALLKDKHFLVQGSNQFSYHLPCVIGGNKSVNKNNARKADWLPFNIIKTVSAATTMHAVFCVKNIIVLKYYWLIRKIA